MDQKTFQTLLQNYNELVKKINHHIEQLEQRYPEDIACKKGCDSCCKPLTVFPVEALNLAYAFARLDPQIKDKILTNISAAPDSCPLLVDKICALYDQRPVICRTHGYPVLIKSQEDQANIDFCPENFKTSPEFSNTDLLDIEQLNTLLLAINTHLVSIIDQQGELPDRISISDALFLLDDD